MNYEGLKNAIENLADSQIVGFYLDPDLLSLRLDFSFEPGEITSVELLNIHHILLSHDPTCDDGRSFIVLEISLNSIEEKKRKDLLNSLGYMFIYNEGSEPPFQKGELYHLRIEGDICMEIVCSSIRILKQI